MSFINFAWNWLTSPAQWHGADGIPLRFVQHLGYSGLSLLVAALIALPLGVLIGTPAGRVLIVNLANAWRPSHPGPADPDGRPAGLQRARMAHPARGPGHSAHPVNAYEGVAGVDRDLTDAARGMGMTESQVLRKVEIPVALR